MTDPSVTVVPAGATVPVRVKGGAVPRTEQPAANRGAYGISVAAELTGMGVQTLHQYEARGLHYPHLRDPWLGSDV